MSTQATSDEEDVLRAGGSVQRVVKLASVSGRYVSVYRGSTAFVPGAAHANNELTCATYDRATGRRLALAEVIGETKAADFSRSASTLLEDRGNSGYRIDPYSFLVDERSVRVCAVAPFPLAGTILEVGNGAGR